MGPNGSYCLSDFFLAVIDIKRKADHLVPHEGQAVA
jgi:hypothetical protein